MIILMWITKKMNFKKGGDVMKDWKVVKSKKLSTDKQERFVVVDKSTGRVIDSCRGYGYKSFQKAYEAFSWKYC